MKYTPQEFIEIWNGSKNVPEVVEKTGFTRGTVRTMASAFRSVGLDLKKMPIPGLPKKENHARKSKLL